MKKQLLLTLIMGFAFGLFAQTTWTVDNKPGAPADFTSLQAAVDSVSPGDVLLVEGSLTGYSGTFDKPLTIIGTGYFLGENPQTQEYSIPASIGITINQGSDGTTLAGFQGSVTINDCASVTVQNIKGTVVIVNSNNIMIRNNYLDSGSCQTGYYGSIISGNCYNLIFKGNYILDSFHFVYGASKDMITLQNNVLGTCFECNDLFYFEDVVNNIILSSDLFYGYDFNDYPNVRYNIFSISSSYEGVNHNSFGHDPLTIFISDTDPRYSDDGRYILRSGSAAIGAGVGGTNCGMFGGGYRLSGIPDIPNIYEFTVPETGYTGESGIQVQVKVKSNN